MLNCRSKGRRGLGRARKEESNKAKTFLSTSKSGINYYTVENVNQSHYRPEVSRRFLEVKVPRLRDNGLGWW